MTQHGTEQAVSEADLWRAFHETRGRSERDRLFQLHYPLAREAARRHFLDRRSGDIEIEDLCQLAGIGLLEAIDRYDPQRGVAFEAFACHRLKGAILDGLPGLSERRGQEELRRKFRKDRARSVLLEHRPRSGDEALAALIEAAVGLAIGFMLEDEGLVRSTEKIDRAASPYQLTAWNETVSRLQDALVGLPEREQDILRRHYFQGMDFQSIGNELGVTKGRVSQIHRAALALLRKRIRRVASFDPKG